MVARDVEDIYPLSPMQQGMMFHTLSGDGSYFEQSSWEIKGPLDVPSFEKAWCAVMNRHPVLRSSFLWEELDEPLQVVHRNLDMALVVQDWRGLDQREQHRRFQEFLGADLRRGFELDEPPLMRIALFRTAEESYRFVWSHHHLLLDGWSRPILFTDLFSSYGDLHKGRKAARPQPRPYRDYIAWLQKQDKGAAEAFWRKVLQGHTAPTPLGVYGSPAGSGGETDYAVLRAVIPAEKTAALQAFIRQHGLTLNTLVQGAWGLLLSRYSGEEDVLFGATVSGRPADLPGSDSMVGLFINTLPVRWRGSSDETVLSMLRGVMAQQMESRQYEYCSLTEIQGWSEVPRSQPLFESILVFENYPVRGAALSREVGLSIEAGVSFSRTNYPLTLAVSPGETIGLELAFDGRRFEPDMIRRMLLHVQQLLIAIAAEPEQPLWKRTPLTEAELGRAVSEWNATAVTAPDPGPVHRVFEETAAETPDATALVSTGDRSPVQLSYGELNRRANQLARYLKRTGVGSETIVGVSLERCPEMVIAILGILKAGGAYLPLDPSYPPDRLAFMVEDSGVG